MSQSNRIYYYELGDEASKIIQNDLYLYNSMMHDAYAWLYHKREGNLHQYLKQKYNTNDYFPLSAISQAKGILSSNQELQSIYMKDFKRKIKQIDKKIKETKQRLLRFQDMKMSIIRICKAKTNNDKKVPAFKNFAQSHVKWNKNSPYLFQYYDKEYTLYLFEVQIVNVEIKKLKHRIKMLVDKRNRTEREMKQLESRMPMVCFGSRKLMKAQYTDELYCNHHEKWKTAFYHQRNKSMIITGRSQGKYSNNLFKYHIEEKKLYYYASNGEVIKLPIEFHLHHEELEKIIKLPHATPGKAICYTLENHGEYFIMKAIMEVPIDIQEFCFYKSNGTIGLDVNADHFAICETDEHGNLVGVHKIEFNIKGITSNQRKAILREAVKQVFTICEQKYKPLIIERLDFAQKKAELKYSQNKKYNKMLSDAQRVHSV